MTVLTFTLTLLVGMFPATLSRQGDTAFSDEAMAAAIRAAAAAPDEDSRLEILLTAHEQARIESMRNEEQRLDDESWAKAEELAATVLRQVDTALHIARLQGVAVDGLSGLVEADLVSRSYMAGTTGYRYLVTPGMTAAVAVPIDPGRVHLMVSDDGAIRYAVGEPATVASPRRGAPRVLVDKTLVAP